MFFACGSNHWAQLGLGEREDGFIESQVPTFQPVALPEGKQVQQVASSDEYTIVLTTDGSLFACGNAWLVDDLLVTGTDEVYVTTFQLMSPLPDGKVAKQIVAEDSYTMILTEDNTVFVCGGNGYGQLGLGDTTERNTFTAVPALPDGKVI